MSRIINSYQDFSNSPLFAVTVRISYGKINSLGRTYESQMSPDNTPEKPTNRSTKSNRCSPLKRKENIFLTCS